MAVQVAALAFVTGNAMAGIEFKASCDLHGEIIAGGARGVTRAGDMHQAEPGC